MSGDLPSHQSIGTMDLCYSKTWPDKQVVLRLVLWPDKQVVLRLVLWPEEVSFQLTMKELL
ncbi:hypothetical protein ACRWYK_22710 [Escherichia coli]